MQRQEINSTYFSSIKEIPKYSFSFRLKCDETKSRRSRDNSFGCIKENRCYFQECVCFLIPYIICLYILPGPAVPAACHLAEAPDKAGPPSSAKDKKKTHLVSPKLFNMSI